MKGVKEIDHGWKRIKREIIKMADSYVKVGILSNAGTYATEGGTINVVDVATFNEFGTSIIPERPFMRQTFEKRRGHVNRRFESLVSDIYIGSKNVRSALGTVGEEYKGFIQSEIVGGGWVSNAPSTVSKKKSSQPLIDTGRLRQSINFDVEVNG